MFNDIKEHTEISIHTFRVEGDLRQAQNQHQTLISIHTFRVEGDKLDVGIRSDCSYISIHTFRVEGDEKLKNYSTDITLFQSTPSVWKVTEEFSAIKEHTEISIHTFRVEGDPLRLSSHSDSVPNFNPHLPCGR